MPIYSGTSNGNGAGILAEILINLDIGNSGLPYWNYFSFRSRQSSVRLKKKWACCEKYSTSDANCEMATIGISIITP